MRNAALLWFCAMSHQTVLSLTTQPRSFSEVTGTLRQWLAGTGVRTGLCHLFLRHTSASLLLTENADADVRGGRRAWRPTAIRSSATTRRVRTTCPRTRATCSPVAS
jgi:hypothetical protein